MAQYLTILQEGMSCCSRGESHIYTMACVIQGSPKLLWLTLTTTLLVGVLLIASFSFSFIPDVEGG